MKFGAVPPAEAEGAVLAHSLALPAGKLKKGRRLSAADVAALAQAGLARVTVARLEPDDIDEDAAAAQVARALAGPHLDLSAPFTGRANLFAAEAAVLRVDDEAIAAANAVDEAVTVATLPDFARVAPRQMAATVKIIPYGAPRAAVEAVCAALASRARQAGRAALAAHPFALRSATLALTVTPGMKPALLTKGADAVRARLAGLGVTAVREVEVAHETGALAAALAGADGDFTLVLTASATSDRLDVGPAAVVAAGGALARFGMPVDPGNLLFLGDIGGRPVLGLPGCARSPKLNGADWVLERLVARLPVTAADIAAMGVGGLLKEIPSRPAPRAGGATAPRRPLVAALLLAAGASRRMAGRDKLMEEIDGAPQIVRAARALLDSRADMVIAVVGPADAARRAALEGLGVRVVENPLAAEGMAASIRAGLAAAPAEADAVLLALADMPEIGPAHVDRLIAAFDPEEGRAICRAATASGAPGHPVLFGRRFFETLGRLEGDAGARAVLAEHADLVELVATPGEAAAVDLDTPEAWAAWRAGRAGAA
ncbi:NTP transferase domain-containing protein [Rubrimonas cliftonensis]|uniref:Molybdopterin molybdochelatase /molybdenum cofactor cytidylyltransferase n=1 Tax=Rubrimonas cliftonensis TaxID=89524 RepID=A0A1H3WQ64_9RHOB|nr:molybdopterin molybdochelatase /molybdenum cofactor cytidylyltransferase [Rubrimonas cliftonensis]